MVTAAIIFQLSTWIYSDEFRWIYNSSKESYNFRKYWKNYFCSSSAEDLVPSKETPNSNASLHVSFSDGRQSVVFLTNVFWRRCCWNESKRTGKIKNVLNIKRNRAFILEVSKYFPLCDSHWPIIMLYGAILALFHVKEIQKSFAAPPTIWWKGRPANCHAPYSLEFELKSM